jgi:hypothetical protein
VVESRPPLNKTTALFSSESRLVNGKVGTAQFPVSSFQFPVSNKHNKPFPPVAKKKEPSGQKMMFSQGLGMAK